VGNEEMVAMTRENFEKENFFVREIEGAGKRKFEYESGGKRKIEQGMKNIAMRMVRPRRRSEKKIREKNFFMRDQERNGKWKFECESGGKRKLVEESDIVGENRRKK
jgi:hypothetical protein